MLIYWSYAKPPRLEDRCADFRLPTHPRPPAWLNLSSTALGVPVQRKRSHQRQGTSTREDLVTETETLR